MKYTLKDTDKKAAAIGTNADVAAVLADLIHNGIYAWSMGVTYNERTSNKYTVPVGNTGLHAKTEGEAAQIIEFTTRRNKDTERAQLIASALPDYVVQLLFLS